MRVNQGSPCTSLWYGREMTRRRQPGTVLFWTSNLGVTYLRPLATELDSVALAMLFDRATMLYEAALTERDATLVSLRVHNCHRNCNNTHEFW